ncbi:hypothetical protein HDU84_007038 [Entophlyctis sp. JEL0112]|nr:hypothetical protein HDU84_007038 [Entophlyctis sp. JEL0112]
MGPKKEKAQKMSLGSFLTDTSTGNWADDVQDLPSARTWPWRIQILERRFIALFISFSTLQLAVSTLLVLPTGPRASAGGEGGFDDRRGGRGLTRGEIIFPTNPPYSAFLGNLSYDISEGDIENLFRDLKIKSLRIMRDIDNNIKGFGYCDFVDLESLKGAVALHGETVKGRMIKIDERPGRSGGFGGEHRERFGGMDDSPADWRNHGRFVPAAAPPPRSPDRERGFGDRFNNRGGDFGEQRRGFGGGYRRDDRNEQSDGPWERKKIELQPRSAAAESAAGANSSNGDVPKRPSSPVKNKPNPFGQATARDEGEIMRRLEERRQQKEAERKAAEGTARQARDEDKEKIKAINKPAAAPKSNDEGSWRRDGPPRINPPTSGASRLAKERDFGRKRISVPVEGSGIENEAAGDGGKGRKDKTALSPAAAAAVEAKRGNVYDVLNADEEGEM